MEEGATNRAAKVRNVPRKSASACGFVSSIVPTTTPERTAPLSIRAGRMIATTHDKSANRNVYVISGMKYAV